MSGLVSSLETAIQGSLDEKSGVIPTGGLSAMFSSNMNVKYRGCYESLYNFLFPLVALKVLRDAPSDGSFQDMSIADKTPGQAIRIPPNKMIYKSYPGAYGETDLNYIVRPNFDCAYNAVYLDLTSCPVVVTVPPIPAIPAKFTSDGKSRERFWNFQLMDAWTNNYVEIGMQDGAGPGQYVVQGFTNNKNNGPVYNPLQSYNIALILLLVIVIIVTAAIFFSGTTTGASTTIMSLIVGICLLLIVLIAVYGKKKYAAVYQCPTNFSYLIIRVECVNVSDFEENLFQLQRQFACSYITPNKCSHNVNKRFNTEMYVPASMYISNPCTNSDDCPMDQYCVANTEYGGYCKTYATDCVYTSDCNPTQYCNTTTHLCTDFPNCTEDSNCDKGEYCDMAQGGPGMPGTPGEAGNTGQPATGVCRLKQRKSSKQICTSDLDCSFTGFCNEANNQCEPRPCFQNMDCPTNQYCNADMVCESMQDAPCKSNGDCMTGQYCNASAGRCENKKTKCTSSADCSNPGETCDTNTGTCSLACTNDQQCQITGNNEYCDTNIGACTQATMKCNVTSDCVDGYGCVNGTCIPIPTTCNPQVPVVSNNVNDEDETDMAAQLSSPGPSMPGMSKLPAGSKVPIPYPSVNSNGQCAQGYECSDGQCEQVTCVPGQSPSNCTPGNICDPSTMTCSAIQSCQSDTDCSMGQTCESGTCTNTPCTTTEGECVVGSYCDPNINYCVPVPTPSGLSCTNDASCGDGMYCNRNLTPAQCAYTTGYSPAPTNPPGVLTEPMTLSTNDIVFNMSADYFYTLASNLIRTVAPLEGGYQNDQMSALLQSINMLPINNDPNMNTFSWNNIPTGTKMGLSSSVRSASKTFAKQGAVFKKAQGTLTNWSGFGQQSGATFGSDKYLIRALEAAIGLGLNTQSTAMYYTCQKDSSINFPPGSNALDGGKSNYTLHFAGQSCVSKIMAPPVQAFWSVTVYTNAGYPVANSQNIFSFGTHSGIVYETDGSIMLYLTTEDAYDPTTMQNWLPIPMSKFSVTFRAYIPDQVIINQSWIPPFINKVTECNPATIKAAFSNTFGNPNVTNVAQCIQSLNTNERDNLYKNIGCQSMKQVIAQCQGYGNAENSDTDTSSEMILYGMNPSGNVNDQARFYQDLGTKMNPYGAYPPSGNPYGNNEETNDAAKNYEKQRREQINNVNTNTNNTIVDAAAPMAGLQNPESITNSLNNNSKLKPPSTIYL